MLLREFLRDFPTPSIHCIWSSRKWPTACVDPKLLLELLWGSFVLRRRRIATATRGTHRQSGCKQQFELRSWTVVGRGTAWTPGVVVEPKMEKRRKIMNNWFSTFCFPLSLQEKLSATHFYSDIYSKSLPRFLIRSQHKNTATAPQPAVTLPSSPQSPDLRRANDKAADRHTVRQSATALLAVCTTSWHSPKLSATLPLRRLRPSLRQYVTMSSTLCHCHSATSTLRSTISARSPLLHVVTLPQHVSTPCDPRPPSCLVAMSPLCTSSLCRVATYSPTFCHRRCRPRRHFLTAYYFASTLPLHSATSCRPSVVVVRRRRPSSSSSWRRRR